MRDRLRPLVAGNWKMNGRGADLAEIAAIRAAVVAGRAGQAEILVCPPATLLMDVARLCAGSPVALGAQDCHPAEGGPHTGDISAEMLKDAGASYVIVGHSERRAEHGESDALVRAKAKAGLRAGLRVILCVGESEAERAAGAALERVAAQLEQSLPDRVSPHDLVIAYEPVWAIGTGLTPTPADVAEIHAFLRSRLAQYLPGSGCAVRILYGGSVKPANAAELLTIGDVDGTLVGGASLKAAEFMAIAGVYRGVKRPARHA
ncbi:MAG TPA: triose-phosphate isomerase [Methylovirgula sp.]|nr:triose-phosphate isomerase [Methylovirgula sp.]